MSPEARPAADSQGCTDLGGRRIPRIAGPVRAARRSPHRRRTNSADRCDPPRPRLSGLRAGQVFDRGPPSLRHSPT